MKYHLVLMIFIFFTHTACASNKAVYEREAQAFCSLHHPNQWKSRSEFTALENFEYLNKKIKSNINSKAFLDIFDKLAAQSYNNFYHAIRPEISKLVGHEWHCDAAKEFYTLNWEQVDTAKDNNEIIITVLESGEFQIKHSRYKLSDIEDIRHAITFKSKGKDQKILFKVPKKTSDKMLNLYLEPLRQIGIKYLTIVYY